MPSISKSAVLKKISSKKWYVQSFNGLPFYLLCAAAPTGWMVKQAVGKNYTHFLFQFNSGRGQMYYDLTDLQKVGDAYYKTIKNVAAFRQLKNKYNKIQKLAETKIPNYKNLKSLPTHLLISLEQSMRDALIYSVGYSHLIEAVSFVSEQRLTDILKTKGSLSQKNLHLLTSPTQVSFLSQAQSDLWRIKNLKRSLRQAAIKEFLKNYFWIENTYIEGRNLTKKEVISKAQRQKRPILGQLSSVHREKARLLKNLGFTSTQKFVVQTIELCTAWQDERKKNILRNIGRMEPVVKELAKRSGITIEQFKFLLPEELTQKKLLDKVFIAQVKKRPPRCVYYATPKDTIIFLGKDYDSFEQKQNRSSGDLGHELRGSVACKGLAKGEVRICQSIKDIKAFKANEVLVASMTRPEHLSAMQKAAAIVTDEGGITGHAAIVSRELGIPCVIGTKIATKIFKNGEVVEVDANNGIVKLLKSYAK